MKISIDYHFIFTVFVLAEVGNEAFCMLGKHCTTKIRSQSQIFYINVEIYSMSFLLRFALYLSIISLSIFLSSIYMSLSICLSINQSIIYYLLQFSFAFCDKHFDQTQCGKKKAYSPPHI